jgi:hypothetical protein
VTNWSEEQKQGYFVNMTRVKAQRRIERGDYDGTDHEGVYNLFMVAFGDENRARDAQAEAAKNLMRASCKE